MTEAADLRSARLAAVLGGQRVEALAERTEVASTWANPDGTLTTETASTPVRIKEAGVWKRLDTTLTDTGTRVEPETAVADVELSDGGTEDFASVSRGSRTFGLDWPKSLPAPELDGDTAVYANAVPGGDLHVTALPHGFSESLILHKRPTAPVELRLPVTLDGMRLEKTASRHLRLESETGALIASAPAPRMWGEGVDPKSGDPTHSMEIATSVEEGPDGTVLVLKPSMEFLTDPAVEYPVNIDPTTTLGASTDTWVATNYPDSQRGSTELKAGTYDAGTTKARSYVKFDVAKFAGKHILSSEFRLHSYWSSSCSTAGSGVAVNRITANWDPSAVTWGAQPATTATDSVVSKSAYGYSSACPANFMRWNVAGIVQAWAGGAPNYGLQVRAVSETDSLSWRRFRSSNYVDGSQGPTEPALVVTYNTKPGVAAPVSPANGAVTADTTPTLQGKAPDADGNTVRVTFEVWNKDGTTRVTTGNSAFVAPGAVGSWTSGALAPGAYKWRMSAYDGTDWNGIWSPWSTLTIDTTTPAAPSISSTAYPADGLWHGNPGQSGAFAVSDPSGKAVSAEYSLDGGATNVVALSGGKGTLNVAPPTRGVHVLSVRVKNAAGTWSESTDHTFRVGSLTGNLDTSFIAEVAETHFAETLHPAEDAEYVEPPAGEEYPEIDDTPPGYVDQRDPEVVETEESVLSRPVVELPATADASIVGTGVNGDSQTVLNMPDGNPAPAELSESGLIVYPNTQTDADTLAIRTAVNSVETFHLLRSPAAPQSFSYKLDLQPGQTAIETGANGVLISDETNNVTLISAPAALDAKGQSIPVSLELTGDTITVALNPAAGQAVSYPVLLDPSYWTNYMTGSEKWYCLTNPIDCTWVKSSATVALEQAEKWYARSTLYQGIGDAFRHCYWNARMEIRLSTDDTYEFATRHESDSSGKDREMDMKNNSVGRGIGRSKTGQQNAVTKARDACRAAQRNGSLWILRSGSLVKSNR
ncbi:DNRLRE domain-containing protein [Streptomyces sp. NPDC026092]|uniref:DNRLRE domain-containing protein n=1 Tax=Streptomyces sp. NPDC026092 TaxID=3154797 RepID=UPI00340BD34E